MRYVHQFVVTNWKIWNRGHFLPRKSVRNGRRRTVYQLQKHKKEVLWIKWSRKNYFTEQMNKEVQFEVKKSNHVVSRGVILRRRKTRRGMSMETCSAHGNKLVYFLFFSVMLMLIFKRWFSCYSMSYIDHLYLFLLYAYPWWSFWVPQAIFLIKVFGKYFAKFLIFNSSILEEQCPTHNLTLEYISLWRKV